MPLIKILCLFFLIINTSNALTLQQVAEKQEEILLQLAQEGIVDAWLQLGHFYQGRLSDTPANTQKMLDAYERAARMGNMAAIYRFGNHWLYNSQNQTVQNEALILVSIAAIAGNERALADLVLLPRVLPLSYHRIENAFALALERMLQDHEPVNCERLPCVTPAHIELQSDSFLSFKIKAYQFDKKMQKSGGQTLDQHLRYLVKNIQFIQEQHYQAHDRKIWAKNSAKLKRNLRLATEAEKRAQADWTLRTYLDRRKQRRTSAEKVIAHHADADHEALKPKIHQLLKKINIHRTEEAEISLPEVMEILRNDP